MASAAAANNVTIGVAETTIFDPGVSGQARGLFIKCRSTSTGSVLIRHAGYLAGEFFELEPGDAIVLRAAAGIKVVTAKRQAAADAIITWGVIEF